MEASKNVLCEAETWNNLGAEVSSLMAKKAYLDVTSRLEEAQNSLAMFQDSDEYDGRLTLLDNLKTQLEHALQPLLSTAIDDREVQDCKNLYNIFSRIHKEEVFLKTYFRSRESALIDLWKESLSDRLNDDNITTENHVAKISSSNFNDFLSKFFEEVFIMLNQEKSWCVEIFPKPSSVIYALICNIFSSLTPSLPSQINMLADLQPITDSLPELIRAFKASEKFGTTVERLLEQLREQKQTDSKIDLRHWGDSIFEGFLAHQCKYSDYESAYLDTTLDKLLKIDPTKETGEMLVRHMLDIASKSFNVINAALSRCLYFTHGFASVGMNKSVSQYICKLINKFNTYCDQLSFMFNDENQITQPQISEEEGIEIDEYQEVNWPLFQLGLELINVCQKISIQIEEYEKNVRKIISFTENILNEEFELGKENIYTTVLGGDSPTDFSIPVQDITVASLTLLKESTLNSLELRSLLVKVRSKPFRLLEEPYLVSKKFTGHCQTYLCDILFATIKRQFIDFEKNAAWVANEPQYNSSRQLQIPKFSLSPSTYITRIGEYLLTLPQQLETYTGHESFGFSLDTLPYSQPITSEHIPPPSSNTSSPKMSPNKPNSRNHTNSTVGDRSSPPGLNRTCSFSTVSSDHSNLSSHTFTTRQRRSSSVSGAHPRLVPANSSEPTHETNRRIEITHRWITSVAQVTQSKLCELILRLEKITPFGVKQIATDIEYFTNILLAIDITPGFKLVGIFKALEWSPETLVSLTKEKQDLKSEISEEDRELLDYPEIREVLTKVTKIRGL
ncbi:hypothetical protein K7432_003596 [Basidiobolus ranarum]|uniref:Conserved oligomeric Golgi complex subunit 7 n=1 Tax=Basidiobolus ranarum TaxID=34480 RepID=A0ABR2W611_9FUNG